MRALMLLLLISFCPLAGCSSELVAVSGSVTLNGEPLPRGTVVFQQRGSATGYGEIRSDGSYEVKTGDQEGLKPGTYRVTVTAYETASVADEFEMAVPRLLTPARYNKPETSGLTAEVGPKSRTFDFDLTR